MKHVERSVTALESDGWTLTLSFIPGPVGATSNSTLSEIKLGPFYNLTHLLHSVLLVLQILAVCPSLTSVAEAKDKQSVLFTSHASSYPCLSLS